MREDEWIEAWHMRYPDPTGDDAWKEAARWANTESSPLRWDEIARFYRNARCTARARAAYAQVIGACGDATRPRAYSNFAQFLFECGEIDEALSIFELAWEMSSEPEIGLGFSSALLEAGCDEIASAFLNDIRKQLEHLSPYWSNVSIASTRRDKFNEAHRAAQRAYELGPSASTSFQLALSQLRLSGARSADAWVRFEDRPNRPVHYSGLGDVLHSIEHVKMGDRVAVVCEQGIGDTLQFIRFASALEARGASVIVAGSPRMIPFLSGSFPTFQYVENNEQLKKLRPKYWVPILTLGGMALGMGYPTVSEPYLSGRSSGVALESFKRVDAAEKIRIGIAWRGNPSYANDHLRSAKLADFQPLLQRDDVRLFALLKDTNEEIVRGGFESSNLVPLAPEVDSNGVFVDTAPITNELDAVISTDTSIAHLSAGLGVPTYLLLNHGADWRWGTPSSPVSWYTTMHLLWLEGLSFSDGVKGALDMIRKSS